MFKAEIIGNLGGDAEIKNDNGRQYVQFSVADTRRFKREDGTEVEVTNWVSCFMANADAKVIPYLKRGTKVFVRGNEDLRLFSSAKDRRMKAGASINVQEIELVGGTSSDDVPQNLYLTTGEQVPVNKLYWVNIQALQDKPSLLYDRKGNPFDIDAQGFVHKPIAPSTTQAQQSDNEGESVAEQSNNGNDTEEPQIW